MKDTAYMLDTNIIGYDYLIEVNRHSYFSVLTHFVIFL